MQLFLFLFRLQHIKRSALQNKQVVVLRMAFRARKVLWTFEKRAPAFKTVFVSKAACSIQSSLIYLFFLPENYSNQLQRQVGKGTYYW